MLWGLGSTDNHPTVSRGGTARNGNWAEAGDHKQDSRQGPKQMKLGERKKKRRKVSGKKTNVVCRGEKNKKKEMRASYVEGRGKWRLREKNGAGQIGKKQKPKRNQDCAEVSLNKGAPLRDNTAEWEKESLEMTNKGGNAPCAVLKKRRKMEVGKLLPSKQTDAKKRTNTTQLKVTSNAGRSHRFRCKKSVGAEVET